MRLMKALTRFLAVTATASLLFVPVAQADRGRGGGYERHQGYDRHDRGRGYERHHDRGRGYERGRGHDRHYDRGHRRDSHYYRSSRPHYGYAPPRRVVIHRPPPVYYAPPRTTVTVTRGYTYGPHYYRGYSPRYSVGHYYRPAPARTVYISEYDRYGLYAPPRGYHWVRDNDRGDAILASVATGAIIGLVVGALAN